ncbi:wall-associated receptor kinase 2-like [Arachis ipaensis]|uniref:wall-associated receptor kinase 2-like n=1 Tax=Arachis ipaensis TaxID=130454 RepID=UPI0007AF894F|nr:wall-associated receptor kinase 2-like [Arachis ipaensis]
MLFVVVILVHVLVEVVAINDTYNNHISFDGYQNECYGIQISYPFGIENSYTSATCFLEESFKLTCNSTISSLIWDNKPAITINVSQGQVDILTSAIKIRYDSSYGNSISFSSSSTITTSLSFIISSKDNQFIGVSCSTYGYFTIYSNTSGYIMGCVTKCHNMSMKIDDRHCPDNRCCELDIPTETVTIQVVTYFYCDYSVVVKNDNYTFSKDHFENLPFKRLLAVFDWSVGNKTCEESRSRDTIASPTSLIPPITLAANTPSASQQSYTLPSR